MPDKVVNKVVFGNQTLMDVTDATATSGDILTGKTAYTADGSKATGSLNPSRYAIKSGVSLNDIKEPGLYYCDNCTDVPADTGVTIWALEVFPSNTNGSPAVVKQILTAVAQSQRYERYYSQGAWNSWYEVGRIVPFADNLSTKKYYRKPGSQSYGSFIILGIGYNIGTLAILCSVGNGALLSKVDLLTGNAYTGGLTITYSVSNGVGWIGLQTSGSGGSKGCIIG